MVTKDDINKRAIILCRRSEDSAMRWENYDHKIVAIYDQKAVLELPSGRRDTFSVIYVRAIDE